MGKFYLSLLPMMFLVACTQWSLPQTSTPVLSETAVLTFTPSPTATLPPTITATPEPGDTGWILLQPGLEQRRLIITDDKGIMVDKCFMVRIDPNVYRFEIHYDQTSPKSLSTWAAETGAQVVVNGGYFWEDKGHYFPTGLFVMNGQTHGESFGDYAGMFTVDENGNARLRWLQSAPYQNEPLQYALQSFPMLVRPGGVLGFSAENDDHLQAQRTVIAQDKSGRFILFASAYDYFTLHQLSKFLVSSNLDLDVALNLDGGPSTGLYVSATKTGIASLSFLPIVITIHNR